MSHTPDLGPDDIGISNAMDDRFLTLISILPLAGYNTTSPSTCPSTAQITMSPSCSSKPRAFKSYSEAARAFADDDVREDVTDAFGKLGRAMAGMLDKFSTVAKQMHTLDLQRVSASAPAPLKPRWDALTKVRYIAAPSSNDLRGCGGLSPRSPSPVSRVATCIKF